MAAEFGHVVSLQLPSNSSLLFPSLYRPPDSVSILPHDLNSDGPRASYCNRLHLIPEDTEYAEAVHYVFLRGPRYDAYAELRRSRLLKKHRKRQLLEHTGTIAAAVTAPTSRKQVKFQDAAATRNLSLAKDVKVSNFVVSGGVGGRKVSSIVAQSVPDFSAVLRKENRRPASEITVTPPSNKKGSPGVGSGWSAKGSKSAGAAEKRAGGTAARKRYASLEELRGSSVRAANAICGGAPGDGKRRILGSRRF